MRQMFLHLGLEFQTFVGIFGEIAGTGKDHIDLDTLSSSHEYIREATVTSNTLLAYIKN